MNIPSRVSTGMPGFDTVIDHLRLGDNVVWQVDSVFDYRMVVDPFVAQAGADGRKLVYVRFGRHEPLMDDSPEVITHHVDASMGFESFATEVNAIVEREGMRAFYVFDCLTDLLEYWYSDLMIGNFFKVTCPFLYELDTIAYFALIRNAHTYSTIAGIRETTQLLLDLYEVDDQLYIHPLKVWQRYSPTMFFPHLIEEDTATSVTASSEVAALFSTIQHPSDRPDFWNVTFSRAREALSRPPEDQESIKTLLMQMLIGRDSKMFELCQRYLTLADILRIASREVGTGFIGGKSVGMLLATAILEAEMGERFTAHKEPHDSFYLGADIFYTYIVENGWWRLRTRQKTPEGYHAHAPELREKLLHGEFPTGIREQFLQMLEYFGASPIIVRSSSLLEDSYGNAFAGKYTSVFCANQGTPEERYRAFSHAVRSVYASTMNEDALAYRLDRGLFDKDEQMAILVQRVSGDRHGSDYFPHVAGVGNSSNLYIWDSDMDMSAGMLRLVFGLGTRAVDRTEGDYARIVTLDDPLRLPPMNYGDEKKFSQRSVDVISLADNALVTRPMEDVIGQDLKTDRSLFVSVDHQTVRWLREMGHKESRVPPSILDFRTLLGRTDFPRLMREALATLERAYDYPVDVEFTANFDARGQFKVNVVQCRPLQTKGLGVTVDMPHWEDPDELFFANTGNFMGGNVRIPLDHVILVRAQEYLDLPEQAKHAVAREIGVLNRVLHDRTVLLAGPGRWGTTTPSLGVPVRFAEVATMEVICEFASKGDGFMPELSYGSHFFQDLVESGIFYVAIFDGQEDVVFNPDRILREPNVIAEVSPSGANLAHVIHVAATPGLVVYSNVVTQEVRCG